MNGVQTFLDPPRERRVNSHPKFQDPSIPLLQHSSHVYPYSAEYLRLCFSEALLFNHEMSPPVSGPGILVLAFVNGTLFAIADDIEA